MVLAVVAAVFAAGYGFVTWRDRARHASGEESAAARDARARQQRYEAERHGAQGECGTATAISPDPSAAAAWPAAPRRVHGRPTVRA